MTVHSFLPRVFIFVVVFECPRSHQIGQEAALLLPLSTSRSNACWPRQCETYKWIEELTPCFVYGKGGK